MKMLKKVISLITVVLMTLMLTTKTPQANIFTSSSSDVSNRNIIRVAVLLYSFDDLFMLKLKESLEEIERENKDKVRFTFYDGKNNISIQNETIDSLSKTNTDLIIGNLANISEPFVEEIVLRAKSKEIPLILLSINPEVVKKVSQYYDKVIFILENADDAAAMQAKILIDLWNSNKKALDKDNDNILQYILLKGQADNPVAINRSQYVISSLNNSGIQTQELALVNANWLKELAKTSIDNLFLKYDGEIEAIISNNDAMAIGAIESLQKYGYNKGNKTKNIAVVGIDAIPEAKDLIDKGFMTGTVIQNPKTLAEVFYNVGMNAVNNLNPIENTDYKVVDGQIIIPFKYEPYTGNTNTQQTLFIP